MEFSTTQTATRPGELLLSSSPSGREFQPFKSRQKSMIFTRAIGLTMLLLLGMLSPSNAAEADLRAIIA
ncbi:MAG: hypothetical protein E5V57_08515, partial [Mesorhizobium sp.]